MPVRSLRVVVVVRVVCCRSPGGCDRVVSVIIGAVYLCVPARDGLLVCAGEWVNVNEIPDPHVVANLLKQYLRELPDPLLTDELYEAFLLALGLLFVQVSCAPVLTRRGCAEVTPSPREAAHVLKSLVWMLPEVNRELLRQLARLCVHISKHSGESKMGLEQLALGMAPIRSCMRRSAHTIGRQFSVTTS
jgi:hypothetical protein